MSTVPMKVTAAISAVDAARANMISYREENKDVLLEWYEYVAAYNDAVATAKNAISDNADQITTSHVGGEFNIVRVRKLDVDVFLETMGEDALKYIVSKPGIDRAMYDRDVAAGIIPQDVVVECEKEQQVQVRGPKEIGIYSLSGNTGGKKRR